MGQEALEIDHPTPLYPGLAELPGDRVRDDGRIDVNLDSRLSRSLSLLSRPPPYEQRPAELPTIDNETLSDTFPVRLNIVIHVVGSRGDVQPFLALGNALQKQGHRVRLATHQKFSAFVREVGLEFFEIGGNPEDLMAYMVKNPGLIPSMKSLRAGDIARKREMVAEMLDGCWSSCIEPDPITGIPFVADAIIANPPSFAHMHCAEALGIPVHIVFTMPWSGTTAFAHPLANIKGASGETARTNYMTYVLVEWLTWQGLGDIINAWREKLGLERVPLGEGPMLADTLNIPHTYCWSPALVPKPPDWGSHIDVSGFFFRDMPDYKPLKELQDFLDAGPPPVYIGFGSIVLEDVTRFSSAVVDAITACRERAIISPGWSKLHVPKGRSNLFCLEECPHEWLFRHVSMVIHHGGAGTTAIGLREARPTIIVPFFADQPFWGRMVAAAGAGPEPIPQREVSVERLAEAIRFCQKAGARDAAAKMSTKIKQEDGVQAAVKSFHANLPFGKLQCDLLPDQAAAWKLRVGGFRGRNMKISKSAAGVLTKDTGLMTKNLKLYHVTSISFNRRRYDPVTGMLSSLVGTGVGMIDGATGIFLKPGQEFVRDRNRSTSAPPSSPGTSGTMSNVPVANGNYNYELPADMPEHATLSVRSTASNLLTRPAEKKHHATAQNMARASGKSLAKVFTSFSRGAFVELPLSVAEGFHSVPQLWGAEVKDYGEVRDWQSGGMKAGTTAVLGMRDGFRDMVTHPVRGAQEGGVLGAAKGLATGTGSLLSNTASASVGLVAYPGEGITKSLHSLVHDRTAKRIVKAKIAEGMWSAAQLRGNERMAVVDAYSGLQRSRKT